MENGLKMYEDTQKASLEGRELEASVLMKAVAILTSCQERWDEPGLFWRLDEALTYNQTVWTVFQAEISQPDSALPKTLREQLLQLSLFIDKRTLTTMSDPRKEKLNILIDINRNIAAGLRGSPSDQEPGSTA